MVDQRGSGRSMDFLNQILSSDVNVVRGIQNIGRVVDKQRCRFALKRPNARASRKKPRFANIDREYSTEVYD